MKRKMDLNEKHNHSLAHLFLHGQATVTIIVVNRRNEMVSVLKYMTTLAQMTTNLLTQYVCTNDFYRMKITQCFTPSARRFKEMQGLAMEKVIEGNSKQPSRACTCHMHTYGRKITMESRTLHTWECLSTILVV
jgi:hypothetical protein